MATTFTPEQREEARKLYVEHGPADASRLLAERGIEVKRDTISQWARRYKWQRARRDGLDPARITELADALEVIKGRRPWAEIARPNQLPPDGLWFIWLILAGRGWGKTRSGAEWVAAMARKFPGCRIALVGQTFADVR